MFSPTLLFFAWRAFAHIFIICKIRVGGYGRSLWWTGKGRSVDARLVRETAGLMDRWHIQTRSEAMVLLFTSTCIGVRCSMFNIRLSSTLPLDDREGVLFWG